MTLDELAKKISDNDDKLKSNKEELKRLKSENKQLKDTKEERSRFIANIDKAFSMTGNTLADAFASFGEKDVVSSFFTKLKETLTTIVGMIAVTKLMEWWDSGGRETVLSGIRTVVDGFVSVKDWLIEKKNQIEANPIYQTVRDWVSNIDSLSGLVGTIAASIAAAGAVYQLASTALGNFRANFLDNFARGSRIRAGQGTRADYTREIARRGNLPDGVRVRPSDGAIVDARGRVFSDFDIRRMYDGTFTGRTTAAQRAAMNAGADVAETAARSADDVAETVARSADDVAETAVRAATRGVADDVAETAGRVAARSLSGSVAEALIKYGVKSIIFVGAAAGLAFTAQRVWKGDYVGAGQELAGVLIPSFLGSATVDLNLAVHDVYLAMYGTSYEMDMLRDREGTLQRLEEIRSELGRQIQEATQVSQEDYVNTVDEFAGLDPSMTGGTAGIVSDSITPDADDEVGLINSLTDSVKNFFGFGGTTIISETQTNTTVVAPSPSRTLLTPDYNQAQFEGL